MFFSIDDAAEGNLATTFVILAVIAVLVMAYSVRLMMKGRAQYARVDKQGGSALLSKEVMEMAYWGLQPIARFLVSLSVTPNMISWTSLFVGLVAGICLANGHFGFGALFAMIAFFFDSLDGIVARMSGVASDAGEVLDTTIDRYVEAFFIGGLIIHYREVPVLQILALAALVGSFMITYSSAKIEALNFTPPKCSMRRPERAAYLTLGALLSPITIPIFERVRDFPIAIGHPMVIALGLVAVMANVSAIERMAAVAKEMRRLEAEKKRAARQALASELSEEGAELSAPTAQPLKQSR